MEADLFQDIFSALEQHNKRIRLPLNNACPIQKIVWSSFDYLRGPELEFVWEADYLRPDNAVGGGVSQQFLSPKSQLNDTTNGAHSDNEAADACTDSTDSSFSKNTGESAASTTQYEEIDEYYNSELLQLSGEPFNANLLCDTSKLRRANRLFTSSLTEDAAGQHQQLMADELSSLNLSSQTDDTLRAVPNSRTPAASNTTGEEEEGVLVVTESFLVDANPSEAMVTSCVDSGIGGTISIESNLSTYAKPELREEVVFNSDDQRCNIRMRKSDIVGYHIPEAEEVIDFKKAYAESTSEVGSNSDSVIRADTGQNARCSLLNNSGSATQIGCSSMFSSFYAPQNVNADEGEKEQHLDKHLAHFYREAELMASEFAPSDPLGNGLSDEAFVAKHVLAEQIGSIQFSSNPVLHKFCLVPCRHLSVGSYIFSTRHSGQSRTTTNTLCAFSVILPLNQSNWYLERQSTFAEMFSDAITRFKAASLVESVEDLVCRCTREFLAVFLLFGALERWPLVMGRDLTQLRIQHSHLWELNKMPNSDFLARCITACLVCRGRCTILGGTPTEMAQLMHTLVAFLQPNDRIFCLRPYKMRFSPYLRLQAIKRSELHQFLDKASTAHWSAALLDIDRRSVSFTGLYHGKHRAQKMRSQQHQIGQIFRDAVQAGMEVPAQILREMDQLDADGGGRSVADILETQTVQAEPSVKDFLDLVHLMPLNRPARISFVDHFHLRLDNRAKALIAFVRDLSIPSPNDKRSALSSKWHLITVRRNLNLLADTSFGIVLARAENLQPEFAEFIAQQTTNAGRHIRQ